MAAPVTSYIPVMMLLSSCLHKIKADYFGDIRCLCICDKSWNPDGSKVVIKSPTVQEYCNCHHLVKPLYPTLPCSGCICNVETRNTTTIKAVVFIILCVVALLFFFMMFLTIIDPLIQCCLDLYLKQSCTDDIKETEDEDPTAISSTSMEVPSTAASEISEFNSIHTKKQKWKGTVQEQRRRICGNDLRLK